MTTTSVRPTHSAGPDSHGAPATADRHSLWCADCGRVVPCSIDEILWFSDTAWPRCCDEVMSLDPPAGPGR